MKKYFTSVLLLIFNFIVQAQEYTPDDALRLANDNIVGTARYRALSGAFGAVGGDLSALNQNPAGSIFFSNNFATVTGSANFINNRSLYWGNKTSRNQGSFDLNQAGAVFIFKNTNPEEKWNKISVALNYENTNNFRNNIFISGINPYNSIDNYFLDKAQGIPVNDLVNSNYYNLNFNQQQALLGYFGYIIESNNDPANSYYTNVPLGGNYTQESRINTTGYNGKLTANFATSYKDKLFLGANLNAHFVDVEKTFYVFETNNNPLYEDGSTIGNIYFENWLYTFGSGISFNLGAIYQPFKEVRVGISYESPTWYRLIDRLDQYVETRSINNPDNISNPFVDPDTIEYRPYYIQTPAKWTGSMAYLFAKKGLLSVDITTRDYSNTRFKPKNSDSFSSLNGFINQNLERTFDIRLGGEYKIKQVSVRGGYRFEQSPYKNDTSFGDLTGYSGGLGYTFGENRIDLAYNYEYRRMNQSLLSSGMNDQARIRRLNHTIAISYSINF